MQAVFVEFYTFRADRNFGPVANRCHVHRACIDFGPVVQRDHASISADGFNCAFHRVVFTDELRNKAVLRTFIQFIRWGKLLNATVVKHRHAVRHGQRFGLVVGHVNGCNAQIMRKAGDLKLHMFAQLFIKRAQWFVHKHQFGFKHQRTRQRDPLLLTTGQLCRAAATKGPHLHHVQRAFNFFLALGLAHLAHFQWERQVFSNGHMREKRVVLEHHPDAALVGRDVIDLDAIQHDVAMRCGLKTRKHHQTGSFTRP